MSLLHSRYLDYYNRKLCVQFRNVSNPTIFHVKHHLNNFRRFLTCMWDSNYLYGKLISLIEKFKPHVRKT